MLVLCSLLFHVRCLLQGGGLRASRGQLPVRAQHVKGTARDNLGDFEVGAAAFLAAAAAALCRAGKE